MGRVSEWRIISVRRVVLEQFAVGLLLAACVLAPALPQIPVTGSQEDYAPATLEAMTTATLSASLRQTQLTAGVVIAYLWH